jgi:hypothetical protein
MLAMAPSKEEGARGHSKEETETGKWTDPSGGEMG